MNQSKYQKFNSDSYNEGPLVDELETRIAALLGKPDALFFNKGTTCQLAALKVHCDNKNNNSIMLHHQSHIAQDEQNAYQALMGLQGIFVGKQDQPITLKDVAAANEEVTALVIELPLRRAGFKLPEWQELLKLRKWCDENQVIMHMDGARLWESAKYYNLAWSSVARLFDSIYVSLYKGLGGISGALLAGDADFLDQCEVWRDRLGSNMWTAFPTLITALQGIDNHLSQIKKWVVRAQEIAQALQKIEGLLIEAPQTNAFQIRVYGNIHTFNYQLSKLIKDMDITPCKPFAQVTDSQLLFTEIQVGAQHNLIKTKELEQFFSRLVQAE